MPKKLIVASTSTLYGDSYLSYLTEDLETHFQHCNEILFIPYARPNGITHDAYTDLVQNYFKTLGKKARGLHQFENMDKAIANAEAIFCGGGNTFLLVTMLYKLNIMANLKQVILKGTPYLGTSAGSNIVGLTMQTTNDMPIVYPPSFQTLGILPFNINPHYLDPIPNMKHMGESRETRIHEFHQINSQPVIGLREGSYLYVNDENIILKGNQSARWFAQHKPPIEIVPESNIFNYL